MKKSYSYSARYPVNKTNRRIRSPKINDEKPSVSSLASQNNLNHKTPNERVKRKPILVMNIDMENGQFQDQVIYKKEEIRKAANNFCRKNKMNYMF